MKNILTLSSTLAVVCGIAAAVLAVAYRATTPAREATLRAVQQAGLRKVLPDFDNPVTEDAIDITAEDGTTVTFYPAVKNGRLAAIAGKGRTTQGFGGTIEVLVGFEPDGRIRAVVITSHSETPGLGTLATERKKQKAITDFFVTTESEGGTNAGLAPNAYLDQYNSYTASDYSQLKVKQDDGNIQAVSGATVSSRAIADAVQRIAKTYSRLLQNPTWPRKWQSWHPKG